MGLLLAGGLLLVCAASAAPPQAAPVVTGEMLLETDGVHAGSAVKAALVAEVAPGYHINDHVPSLDYLIPTELKLQPGGPLSLGSVIYPKGVDRKFTFLEKPISVYEGRLVVGVPVKVAANTQPGVYQLKGALDYQACNDRACLAPTSLPLILTVKVVTRNASVRRVNSDAFSGLKFN